MNDNSKIDLKNLNSLDKNSELSRNIKELTIEELNKKLNEEPKPEDENLFSLNFHLFNLKLSKKRFLVFKKVGFKSHLVSNLKKKIANLKKLKNNKN